MKNILVTGSNGQLGNEIRNLAGEFSDYHFDFTDIAELDITSPEKIKAYLNGKNFDTIINCAAYTAVDKAETDHELAKLVNCTAVKNLAEIAKANNMLLIHISTDYVFDGKNYKPYMEDDPVNPQGKYGKTKLEGEKAIFESDCHAVILRTSWLYSTFGNNFVKTIRRLAGEKGELRIIFDQIGSPTYAYDLARTILTILPKIREGKTEIYHFSDEGICSWYDFAKEIVEISNLQCKVIPIESWEYPATAPRPHYSVFNKAKIKKTFGLEIPHWKDSLIKCVGELNSL